MRARARRAMTHAGPLASVAILLIVVALGAWRLERSRLAALDIAARLIDLRAGELARRLDADPLADPQARLEHALVHGSLEAGIAVIADDDGAVRAIWPTGAHGPASLADALGGDPLLSFFADKAGAIRIEPPGRAPAYAAVRALAHGQVALIVSEREMLAEWRADARALAGLLAAVVLVLSGCAAAFHLDARRMRATAARAAARRANLDMALRHGRCGLWSWDLAQDRIICSTSMFDLIGAAIDPDPLAVRLSQAAAERDGAERAVARDLGDLVERAILGMQQAGEIRAAQNRRGARRADQIEH